MTSAEHRPRIALIHALAESAEPAHAAFAEIWPEAWCWDLLDTSLSADRAEPGVSDDAMIERCVRLADYAANTQGHHECTDAILFTCSAFGPGIEAAAARHAIPVLKPNQSAFEEALTLGDEIGVVVTFAPSAASLETDLRRLAQASGRSPWITTILAEGALAARRAGDLARHDALIAEAAARLEGCGVVLLGQFSMARARPTAMSMTASTVIATPRSAVAALRRRLVTGDMIAQPA